MIVRTDSLVYPWVWVTICSFIISYLSYRGVYKHLFCIVNSQFKKIYISKFSFALASVQKRKRNTSPPPTTIPVSLSFSSLTPLLLPHNMINEWFFIAQYDYARSYSIRLSIYNNSKITHIHLTFSHTLDMERKKQNQIHTKNDITKVSLPDFPDFLY